MILTLSLLGSFAYCFHLLIDLFSQNISFRNTIRMLNSLDPDQARQNVGPDLGPNCLQRLSTDDTSCESVKSKRSVRYTPT